METNYFILLLFCTPYCFGQVEIRKPLHGQMINDSIKLETGTVENITAKTKTFISPAGFFDILVREKDTLLFSGLAFETKRLILAKEDLKKQLVLIKVKANVNEIEAVIIPKMIKPNLGNMQAILDKKYFDDAHSAPKNRLMPPDGSIENGIDFVRIFKGIFRLFKSNKPEGTSEVAVDFTETVTSKIKPEFFISTLKLKEEQIGLFLIYCGNDPKGLAVAKTNSEFEIMDFLFMKIDAFKANYNSK